MPMVRSPRRIWLAPLVLISLSVAARAVDDPPPPVNSAIAPEPRPGAWVKQHEGFLEEAGKGNVGVLFLGDSITQGWKGAGKDVWARHYAPRKAANFGIGGDRTQHVLWRLDNGEVAPIKPKVVVLMIGTNNLGTNNDDQIVEGINTVVARLRSKLPESKVLLLAVFPRGANRSPAQPSAAPEPRIAKINERIAKLDDGKMIKYLDIGAGFLDANGQVPREIMPDFLHLSRKGYQLWADAIEPTLWEMVDQK
jgi:lysophospholipase L1-like esterase